MFVYRIIDVSEKVNKMIENKQPILDIAIYYYHFTIYFANSLFLNISVFIDYLVSPNWLIIQRLLRF
jgi:hypothetical protein